MSEIINILTLIFVASSVSILLLRRLGHPIIPAYILAGIAVGSYIPEQQILSLSQLGIAFLVFIFGIKTDLDRMKDFKSESVITTLLQMTVVGSALLVFCSGIGLDLYNSLYIAMAGALSSSLVGLELIESEIRVDILHGRLAESIQLVQDIIALVLITLIAAQPNINSISTGIMFLVATLSAGLFIRQFLIDKISKLAGGSRELLTMFSIALLLGFTGISELVNSSIVVGSFAAGIAVSKFPHNMEIMDTMGSLKDFFSAILFTALGALLIFPNLEILILTIAIITATLILKPLITGITLLINGYDKRTSYLTGISLDQVSEFALIITIQAYIAQTISPNVFNAIILSATITMMVSSYTSRYEEEIYQKVSDLGIIDVNSTKINERVNVPEEIEDHIIVLGYDTQGKEITEGLNKEDTEFIIIENNPELISEIAKENENYVFGDAMDLKTWEKAFYKQADLIVSTVPMKDVSERILELETSSKKIVRSENIEDARKLLDKGAYYVNVPSVLSSEELVEHLKSVMKDKNYREELRRKNLLEIRKELKDQEN